MIAGYIITFTRFLLRLGHGKNTYRRYETFAGMEGPINCMSFSHDGELLASGGDDETVRIWNIATKKCAYTLEDTNHKRGQITCLSWLGIGGSDDLRPIAFGTGRGLLVIYRQKSKTDASMIELASIRAFDPSDPVEALAYDPKASRLALTSHFGRIAIYEVSRNGTMSLAWNANVNRDKEKTACIPHAIKIHENGKKLLIFMLETGEMICRDMISARENWRKILKSGIGNANISSSGKMLLVENLSTGYDLYTLPRSSLDHSFLVPTKKRCIKDGIFGEQDSIIICGTDHGKVFIFSIKSETPQQVLKHCGAAIEVQTVAALSTADFHLIASANSAESSHIVIWKKEAKKSSSTNESISATLIALLNALIVFVLLYWTAHLWVPILQNSLEPTLSGGVSKFQKIQRPNYGYSAWNPEYHSAEDDDDDDEVVVNWKSVNKYLEMLDTL